MCIRDRFRYFRDGFQNGFSIKTGILGTEITGTSGTAYAFSLSREEYDLSLIHISSIMLAVICGFALLVLGMVIARPILTFMDTPADVMEYAVLYLRIYFLGTPFIMLYNFGAAVLRSVGDTRRPLILSLIHIWERQFELKQQKRKEKHRGR